MRKAPKPGTRVSYAGRDGCGPFTGTVNRCFPTFIYDDQTDRPTNVPEPESDWHVSVTVDQIPDPWPYPGTDRIAPKVADLKRVR